MNANKSQIVEIGEANFESAVLKSKQPVLVAFCAPWSHPCHILNSVLNEVAAACAGIAKVARVNADDNPDLSLWYAIQSIPTLLYFVNGTVHAKVVGTASKEAILAKLQPVSTAAFPNPSLPAQMEKMKIMPTTTNKTSSPAAPFQHYSARQNHHQVDFFCQAPDAAKVALIGDFNRWQPGACPMHQMPDGCWTASLELSHGYHQYLFLVDGKPMLDPSATGETRNERNEPVSLIAVS
jgi:thioredoxin 1